MEKGMKTDLLFYFFDGAFFKNFNPHLNFPHFLNSFLYHLNNICLSFTATFHV